MRRLNNYCVFNILLA